MRLDEAESILNKNGYLVEKEEGNYYSVRICYTDKKGEIASTTIIEFTDNNKLAEEKALNKFKKKFEYETIRWIDSEELKLKEAKQILKNNGYELKEKTTEVPTNKVYIVVMDGGENDDDYAVFRDILEAHKWGDNNCKYDYTVKTSKML